MLEVALVDKIYNYQQKVNHLGSFLLSFLIKYYCYLGIQHVVDRPKSEQNREITRLLKKWRPILHSWRGGILCGFCGLGCCCSDWHNAGQLGRNIPKYALASRSVTATVLMLTGSLAWRCKRLAAAATFLVAVNYINKSILYDISSFIY
jgi:hypothetical protein